MSEQGSQCIAVRNHEDSSVAVLRCSHGPWEFICACVCSYGDVNHSVQLSPVAQTYGRACRSVVFKHGWHTVGG